ncbi:Methylated-DNA--protein-cysteine methyltransferase, partial [Podiceps cristatus]
HFVFLADSFTRQVLWTLLRDVKFGEAVSYKQLAELAGNSRAARAVGGAMRSNPIPILIPCHRVIRSSGQTGNYGGGNLMKEWLLSH